MTLLTVPSPAPPSLAHLSLLSCHPNPGHLVAACGHLLTAIVGAGVLSVPYAASWLGWVAFPPVLLATLAVSAVYASLLCAAAERAGVGGPVVVQGADDRKAKRREETVEATEGAIEPLVEHGDEEGSRSPFHGHEAGRTGHGQELIGDDGGIEGGRIENGWGHGAPPDDGTAAGDNVSKDGAHGSSSLPGAADPTLHSLVHGPPLAVLPVAEASLPSEVPLSLRHPFRGRPHHRRRPQTYSQLTRTVLGPGAGAALATLQLAINALACFAYAIAAVQALQGLGVGSKPWSDQGDPDDGWARAERDVAASLGARPDRLVHLAGGNASTAHSVEALLAAATDRVRSLLSSPSSADSALALRHLPGPPHPLEGSPTAALLFACVQMALACSGGMAESWWSSAIGAAAALLYAVGTVVLAAPKARAGLGSPGGRRAATTVGKTLGVSRALGTLAFAFAFPTIAVEVQASLGKLAARDAKRAHRTRGALVVRPGGLAQALRSSAGGEEGESARAHGGVDAPTEAFGTSTTVFSNPDDASAPSPPPNGSSSGTRAEAEIGPTPARGDPRPATGAEKAVSSSPSQESSELDGASPRAQPEAAETLPGRRPRCQPKLAVTRSMPVDIGRWSGELGARGLPPARPQDEEHEHQYGQGAEASRNDDGTAPLISRDSPSPPDAMVDQDPTHRGSTEDGIDALHPSTATARGFVGAPRDVPRRGAVARFLRSVFGLRDAASPPAIDPTTLTESVLERGRSSPRSGERSDDAAFPRTSSSGLSFPLPHRHRPFSNSVEDAANPIYRAIKPGTVTFGALFCRAAESSQSDARRGSRPSSLPGAASGGSTPRGAEKPAGNAAIGSASRGAAARWGVLVRSAFGDSNSRESDGGGRNPPIPAFFRNGSAGGSTSPSPQRPHRPSPRSSAKAAPSVRFSSSTSSSSLLKLGLSFPTSSTSSEACKDGLSGPTGGRTALPPASSVPSPFDAPAASAAWGVSSLFGLLPWISRAVASIRLLPPTQAERRALAEEAYAKGLLQRAHLGAQAEGDAGADDGATRDPSEYDYYQEYVACRRFGWCDQTRGASSDDLAAWTPSSQLIAGSSGALSEIMPYDSASSAGFFGPPRNPQHRPGGGLGFGLRPVSLASLASRSWNLLVGGNDRQSRGGSFASAGALSRDVALRGNDAGLLAEPLISNVRSAGAESWISAADERARVGFARPRASFPDRHHGWSSLSTPASLVAAHTMRRAVLVSLATAGVLYAAVGVLGYAAFGDAVASDVLSQPSLGPSWAVRLADVAVVVHLGPAFQVFALPVFVALETAVAKAWAAVRAKPWGGLSDGRKSRLEVRQPMPGGTPGAPPTLQAPRRRWTVWREESRGGLRHQTADDESADDRSATTDGVDARLERRSVESPGDDLLNSELGGFGSLNDAASAQLSHVTALRVPRDASDGAQRTLARVPTRRGDLGFEAAPLPSPFVFPNPVTYHINGSDVHALYASEARRGEAKGGLGTARGRGGGRAHVSPSPGIGAAFFDRSQPSGDATFPEGALDARSCATGMFARARSSATLVSPHAPSAGSALPDSEGKALLLESPPFIGPALAAELAAAEDRAWGYEAPLLGHKGVKRADDGSEVPPPTPIRVADASARPVLAARVAGAATPLPGFGGDSSRSSIAGSGLFPVVAQQSNCACTAPQHPYGPVLFSPAVQAVSAAGVEVASASVRPPAPAGRASLQDPACVRPVSCVSGELQSDEAALCAQPATDPAGTLAQPPSSGPSTLGRATFLRDSSSNAAVDPNVDRRGDWREDDSGHSHAPSLPAYVRLPLRWSAVAATTALALRAPSFGSAAGAIGALVFWPLGIFLPTLLFLKTHPETSPLARAALVVVGAALLVVAVAMLLGAAGSALGWAA